MHFIIVNLYLSFLIFSLYVLASVLFVHENNVDLLYFTDVHMYNTRGRHNLLVPKCRLQKISNSYKILSIKFYNKFPLEIRNIRNFKVFKYRVKSLLLQNIYIYIYC